MKNSTTLALAGVAALTAGLTFAGTAQAAPGDAIWEACATTDVSQTNRPDGGDCDPDVVKIEKNMVTFTGSAPANVEALELDWQIKAGDEITFDYTGPCGGGAPRVYITIGGTTIYSTADAAVPCGDGEKVTYKLLGGGQLKGGAIGGWDVAAAGVVRDSGAEGTVTVSNVKIGDRTVDFLATAPTPTPTVTATPTATATASPTPTTTATASPTGSATTSAAPVPSQSTTQAGGLPVTGASGGKLAAIAAALLAAGAGALVVARRRRDKVNFTA